MTQPSYNVLWVVAVGTFLWAISVMAESKPSDHMAEVVYHLCKFVSWPEESSRPAKAFRIEVIAGSDAFSGMAGLNGRRIFGRSVEVRHASETEAPGDGQVVLVGERLFSTLDQILEPLAYRPILTISNIPGFANRGGIIELISTGDQVRFFVNLEAARKAGLTIHAPLLQMSEVLEGLPPSSHASPGGGR